jgi:hypothetical protein
MSLQGLQGYTQPLVLNGETTIEGTLNAKNIYISGTLTGGGISTDILGTDNTWTGTNDFQDVVSYTGVNPAVDFDETTKLDVDTAVAGYSPLDINNEWGNLPPTFSNANPPVKTPVFSGATIQPNDLYSYTDMTNYTTLNPSAVLTTTNTFTGTNTFSGAFTGVGLVSLESPTLANQPASKAYIDAKIEVAGKVLTYTINTPGSYNFASVVNRANIAKIDYWLFGGSCGGASGSVVSGTIGNGNGVNGSPLLVIGTTADPAVVYTDTTALPSTTTFSVSNVVVGKAIGACNLNGVITAGTIGTADYSGSTGLSCAGVVGNNALAYTNVFGTSTSAGGAIFVAYYI